jgi:hypothetical protein
MAAQVWPARHDLGLVDYKALTGLSLLWIPHFCVRHGASLKYLNLDTLSADEIQGNTPTSVKHSSYEELE